MRYQKPFIYFSYLRIYYFIAAFQTLPNVSTRYFASRFASFGFVQRKAVHLYFRKKIKQPDRSQHCGCINFYYDRICLLQNFTRSSIETEKQISDLLSSIIEFDNSKTDIQKPLFIIN